MGHGRKRLSKQGKMGLLTGITKPDDILHKGQALKTFPYDFHQKYSPSFWLKNVTTYTLGYLTNLSFVLDELRHFRIHVKQNGWLQSAG